MKLRHAYWLLCIPGLLVPYAVFMPWLLERGLYIPLFVQVVLGQSASGSAKGADGNGKSY